MVALLLLVSFTVYPSRFFLSSFSKIENGEKARLLLIEKLKAAVASGVEESVAFNQPTRLRIWFMDCSTLTFRTLLASSKSLPSLNHSFPASFQVVARK